MWMVACALLVLAAWYVPASAGAAPAFVPAAQSASICDSVTEIPLQECQALVDFYTNAGGPAWTDRAGWLETPTPCSWRGVGCTPVGASPRHVISFDQRSNGLSGTISRLLDELSELILMLASDTANYMTGAVITIDGGYTLW
jgi:hypothetical protein